MILLCAAMKIEHQACVRAVRSLKNSKNYEVLLTGMGLKSAEAALRRRLTHGEKPSLIISTGCAGSLTDEVKVGSWVQASEVQCDGQEVLSLMPTDPSLAVISPFRSVAKVVLHDRPASVFQMVDMESYALARVAREFSIPFQVLRVVSDTPSQPVPRCIPKFLSGGMNGVLSGMRELFMAPRQSLIFILNSLRVTWILESGLKKKLGRFH